MGEREGNENTSKEFLKGKVLGMGYRHVNNQFMLDVLFHDRLNTSINVLKLFGK